MIRKLLFAFAAMLLIATSCKKEDENQPPSKPKLLAPAKGAIVAPESITFSWEASTDAEGEAMEYDLAVSSDSLDWKYFLAGATSSKTITNKQGSGGYYAFEPGKKYYWKLSVDSKDAGGKITGSNESDVVRFYTTPTGVANLSKTSGDGFVNLAWIDPAGLSKVEVTFSPTVSGISQPIAVNPGVGKVELQGMSNSTIYSFYVKAYNSLGHTSKTDTIKAMPLSPTLVHDADFNIYTTVKIGTQTWMRENLRTTRWQNGKEMKDGYNKFYKVGSQSNIYGYYYNIDAVSGKNQGENPCPCGYHVPSDEDMKTLERFLGMSEADLSSTDYRIIRGERENIGKMLKSKDGWNDYNGISGNGTNLYGFNLLAAGYVTAGGTEAMVGSACVLWTTTKEPLGVLCFVRCYSNQFNGVQKAMSGWDAHHPIRCVKD